MANKYNEDVENKRRKKSERDTGESTNVQKSVIESVD